MVKYNPDPRLAKLRPDIESPSTSGTKLKQGPHSKMNPVTENPKQPPITSGTDGFIRDKREVKPPPPRTKDTIELKNKFEMPETLETEQTPQLKIAPIFATIKNITAAQLKSLTGNYKQVINLKYTINNALIINAHTQEAKTHVLSELEKMKVQFHTQDEARATVKRTMKGLPPSITNIEIEEDLKEKGFTTIKVRQLFKTEFKEGNRTKTPIPVWILTVDKESADTELLENLKEILYTKIRTEAYKGLQE